MAEDGTETDDSMTADNLFTAVPHECDHGTRIRRYGQKNDRYWTAYMCPVKECPPEWVDLNDALLEWVNGAPETVSAPEAPSGHIVTASPVGCPRCTQLHDGGRRLHEIIEDHKKHAGEYRTERSAE